MKILYIGHEKELNGASRSLLDIISVLEHEHDIYVLTSFGEGSFYDELNKHNVTVWVEQYYWWSYFKRSEAEWEYWKKRWEGIHSKINENVAKMLAERVFEYGIDIIHSNTSVVNIGALIKKYIEVKHIWHIREFGDLDFSIYPLVEKDEYYYELNHLCDRCICVSEAVSGYYSAIKDEKKCVIYNGVDCKNIIDPTERTSHSGTNLLISGTISKGKGQHTAILACNELLKRGITDFKLFIAGIGTLEMDISEELRSHVVFCGRVEDMRSLRKKMDIALVCSNAEAFGRVTVEAMMAGLPVIGSNSGGTVELIQDYKNGLLFEVGNYHMLADKIECLIHDKTLSETLAVNAQSYSKNLFTKERCVSDICRIYEEVMEC